MIKINDERLIGSFIFFNGKRGHLPRLKKPQAISITSKLCQTGACNSVSHGKLSFTDNRSISL